VASSPAVASAQNSSAPWRPDTFAARLGYVGVVPLVLCLAGVGLLPGYDARELAQRGAIAWGAVLLAFYGAAHFGRALAAGMPAARARRAAATVPPVIAAAALLIGGQRALALLVVGHGGLWLYEHRVLGRELPAAYLNLRRQLAFATCVLLALTVFMSDAAGLS
jgi:Protein of unknown function (DUF3429)